MANMRSGLFRVSRAACRYAGPLLMLLSGAAAAQGKTVEQRLRWEELPAAELAGRPARVWLRAKEKGSVSGVLVRVEPAGMVIGRRGKEQLLARSEVDRFQVSRRKRAKWSLIGAAIGAGAATPLLAIAEIFRRNEGGINSGKIVAGTAAVVGLAGLAGYLAGRGADVDHTVIHVVK